MSQVLLRVDEDLRSCFGHLLGSCKHRCPLMNSPDDPNPYWVHIVHCCITTNVAIAEDEIVLATQ